jgi:Flp pilus assembly protein TadG
MRLPATSPRPAALLWRRFRRDGRASAAIEFALIAPLFFAMLFAIFETALMFFAGQVLETGTQDSARLMLTNQAQNSSMTQTQFKQDLCNRVSALFKCTDIVVTVRSYPAGTLIPATDLADPIANRSFVYNVAYQVPNPGDTVLVRAFYQWPTFVTGLGYDLSNLGSGADSKRLLAATAAYRVEPNGS